MADEETSVATEEEPEQTPELEAGDPGEAGLALVHHAPEHTHPSPAKYVGIAIFLAIITAARGGASTTSPCRNGSSWPSSSSWPPSKFALVAGFFMHLKFDSPMLRRVFITGIILAGVVYSVALFTLRVLI